RQLANLAGPFDEHLRLIEQRLDVHISNRGPEFHIQGHGARADVAASVLQNLFDEVRHGMHITPEIVHLHLREAAGEMPIAADEANVAPIPVIRTKKLTIKTRGKKQQGYVREIKSHDIKFGICPSDTGNTYTTFTCDIDTS